MAKKRKPLYTRKSQIERLEERAMLTAEHVFAQFAGEISNPDEIVQIPISVNPSDFDLQGGRVLLGFQVETPESGISHSKWGSEFGSSVVEDGMGADLDANGVVNGADFLQLQRTGAVSASSSGLDPAAVATLDSSQSLLEPVFSSDDTFLSTNSIALTELSFGDYTIQVSSENGTTGAFVLNVFLVGDADGNGTVERADHTAIAGVYGSTLVDTGEYFEEADSNLDGRITTFDRSMWNRNRNDVTSVDLLSLMLDSQPDSSNVPALALTGSTIPGQIIELDTNDDGLFDDGMATADGAGAFSFDITLVDGVNSIAVRVQDSFGQQQTSSLTIELITSSGPLEPAFDLATESDDGNVGDQSTSEQFVTLRGQTDPNTTVELLEIESTTISDASGAFTFYAVPLLLGQNEFTAIATDTNKHVILLPTNAHPCTQR